VCDQVLANMPLPSGWTENVKSAIVHVISLAHYAIACARGWAGNSINARVRLTAKSDRLQQEVELLREEIRIKDTRMAKLDPRRRPYYPPTERMAILELKAVRGWSLAQTAKAFLVRPATIASWLKRIDEEGDAALVQLREPLNRFPDFVRHIVQRLKALCPSLGKRKIAQFLARAGLHLGSTTVQRMIRSKATRPPAGPIDQAEQSDHIVTAKRPDHVHHVDLTVVPTSLGMWTAWMPFALPQRWPFCWWVALVIDHFWLLFTSAERPASFGTASSCFSNDYAQDIPVDTMQRFCLSAGPRGEKGHCPGRCTALQATSLRKLLLFQWLRLACRRGALHPKGWNSAQLRSQGRPFFRQSE